MVVRNNSTNIIFFNLTVYQKAVAAFIEVRASIMLICCQLDLLNAPSGKFGPFAAFNFFR